jgi:hypothetical protein
VRLVIDNEHTSADPVGHVESGVAGSGTGGARSAHAVPAPP